MVAAIHDRTELRTGVEEKSLEAISRLVETFSGKEVAANAPIVGRDVFTHTAGIHSDGDAKGDLYGSRLAPRRFGRSRQYALGKLSGKASLDHNLSSLGIELTPAKRDLALGLGATHALDPGDDVPGAVATITHGELADNVFVAAGSRTAIESGLPLVASMGALVLVGMPPSGVRIDFDPGALAAANQRILGSKMGTTTVATDIPRLIQYYEAGRLRLDELISGRFPLEEINTAIDQVRSGSAVRNVIVFEDTPSGWSGLR